MLKVLSNMSDAVIFDASWQTSASSSVTSSEPVAIESSEHEEQYINVLDDYEGPLMAENLLEQVKDIVNKLYKFSRRISQPPTWPDEGHRLQDPEKPRLPTENTMHDGPSDAARS